MQLGSALLAVYAAGDYISDGANHTDDVGGRPGDVEADVCVGDVGHADEGVEAAGIQAHLPLPFSNIHAVMLRKANRDSVWFAHAK